MTKRPAARVHLLALALLCGSWCSVNAAERVPFVGCAADGQVGPLDPPTGSPKSINVGAQTATQLGYYEGGEGQLGVLAPRGWDCFEIYGSSGETIIVAPRVEHNLFAAPITDPAILFSSFAGETSGANAVADYLSRLFPKEGREFVEFLVKDGRANVADFHFGPFPDDHLTYKRGHLVEFVTPPGRNGIGTMDRLAPSSLPISGFVNYLPERDASLLVLFMRLPPELSDLKAAILSYSESNRPH